MLIDRIIKTELDEALKNYPIVVITGARQTGKTTLAKLVKGKAYLNLELPNERELAIHDPMLFLNSSKMDGAIIDEFQRVPDLASYLQVLADERQENGLFILTGSNNFLLMEKISQSLAGRVSLLKLLPLAYQELKSINQKYETDELIYRGFYPAIHVKDLQPTKAYANYYQTYVERDIRQLINVKDMHLFQRFIQLCAGRIGQVLNMEQLANESGTSSNTIKSWLSVLEASYLIFLLRPFHENLNKRVVKSAKLYFHDVGLASYILGIESVRHITNHPLRGALFENIVISEYLKFRFNKGLGNNACFFRDNHQNEIDLVLKSGNNYTLVEIKASQTYHNKFREKLDWFEKLIQNKQIQKVVVYDGEKEWFNDNLTIINFRNFSNWLNQFDNAEKSL